MRIRFVALALALAFAGEIVADAPDLPGATLPPIATIQAPLLTQPEIQPELDQVDAPLGTASRLWSSGEYLLWWVKPGPIPVPLLTTGSPKDKQPGVLGRPSTVVLNLPKVHYYDFSGARVTLVGWVDGDRLVGIEASGFFLPQHNQRFDFSSQANGFPLLAIPFVSVANGKEAALVLSNPNKSSGSFDIASHTRLWGSEANAVLNLCEDQGYSVALLAGARYLDLEESLELTGTRVSFTPRQTTIGDDKFSMRTQFFGGQVGFRGELRCSRLFLNGTGKIALGYNHDTVNVSGNFTQTIGNQLPQSFPGAFFTQANNIGTLKSNYFAAVPEVQANLGVDLLRSVRVFVGTNYIYLTYATRPGDQINRTTLPLQATPGVNQVGPLPLSNSSGFWAHGLNIGLEWHY